MIKDLLRLAVGLLMMSFHREIASFIFVQERQLVDLLARRGWNLPSFSSERAAHDLYFTLGVFVCCMALLRLYGAL
jgi:N-acyl-L-homoserine lactone synthetase